MKKIFFVPVILLAIACNKPGKSPESIELVTVPAKQEALFRNLLTIINSSISEQHLNDSLAFLVLPVQASCPSCRKKTIDSIVKYQDQLALNHFIIISANAGRKSITGYFRDRHSGLPVMDNRLFLDSTNQADKYDLYDEKPTMYYAYNRKVYKKVAAIPATVKQDLQEFFSGYRTDIKE